MQVLYYVNYLRVLLSAYIYIIFFLWVKLLTQVGFRYVKLVRLGWVGLGEVRLGQIRI